MERTKAGILSYVSRSENGQEADLAVSENLVQ